MIGQKLTFMLMAIVLIASACEDRCVDCTIKHFDNLDVIAVVPNICGDEDELAVEEANLHVEYRCVECVIFTSVGPQDSGILCGKLQYTDSIEQSYVEEGQRLGVAYTCEFFSDTLVIVCHPVE